MKVILVCLTNFQEYILDNIKNLHMHNNYDITVITEPEFFNYFGGIEKLELIDKNSLADYNYNNNSKLDKEFRNGFWNLCSLRLFYLCNYIEKYNIENSLHIENDVLLYYDLNDKLFNSDKMCVAFDCSYRVIPSVIYIPSYHKLKYIIDNYNFGLNDMQNLAGFNETILEKLPIFNLQNNDDDEINKLTAHFYKYNLIFDAAAIGQYLGGVDERNIPGDTRGFVNETCLIKFDNYNFYWKKINELYYPFIEVNGNLIQIFNLHIHSKKLHNFLSNNPIEDKNIKHQL